MLNSGRSTFAHSHQPSRCKGLAWLMCRPGGDHRSKPESHLDPGNDPPLTAQNVPGFQELVHKHWAKWLLPHPSFATHLEDAANDPTSQPCSEDTGKVLRALLGHGIIYNLDAAQRSLGRFVIEHLLQNNILRPLEQDTMAVPTQTRLLFVHLEDCLDITIFLFSNRGIPRVYYPYSGTSDSF